MRPVSSTILITLLCACSPEPSAVDAPTSGDGRPSVDASAATADARPAVTVDVVCAPYVRTSTSANGARLVSTVYWGVVPSIGPEDDYAVTLCGFTSTPPYDCPTGSTCSGMTQPSGDLCYRTYRGGQFIDGKLAVQCGTLSEHFAPDGTLTGSGSTGYASVRVTTY